MVYSKSKSFRCNTYKKHGGRDSYPQLAYPPSASAFNFQLSIEDPDPVGTVNLLCYAPSHGTRVTGHPLVRPIAAGSLWCHNRQRHEISSRSEETTPLSSVSKTIGRTSGTVRRRSRLPRLGRGCKFIALRSHLQEGRGPSF